MSSESGVLHKKQFVHWSAAIGVLLLAAAVRLYELDRHGLWYDEILTALRAQESMSWLLLSEPLRTWPLLYLINKSGYLLFGSGDFAVRLPAVFEGILAVALVIRVGRRFYGWREGLIAALLLALSPLYVHASRDARYYALAVLLCLATTYLLWRALTCTGRRCWIGFVVATALNLYNHPSALLLLAGQGAFLAWVVVSRLFRKPTRRRVGHKQPAVAVLPLVAVLSLLVAMAVAYLFLLPGGMTSTLLGQSSADNAVVSLSWPFFLGLINTLGSGMGLIPFVFLGAFLLGLVFSLRSTPRVSGLLALVLLVPLACLPLLMLRMRFVYKYLIFMLPLYLLLVGRGVTALFDVMNETPSVSRFRPWPAALACLLVLGILTVSQLGGSLDQIGQGTESWREIGAFLKQHVSPGDVVAAPPMLGPLNAPSSRHVLDYYQPVPADAEFRIVYSTNDLQRLCAGRGQVWLILTPPYTRMPDLPYQWSNATAFGFYPQFRIVYRDCSGVKPGGQ